MVEEISESETEAGTGFMTSLSSAIRYFEKKGYTENMVPNFDHLECQSGKFKFYAKDFQTDEVRRFENTSDPDDQAILYAVSSSNKNLKGLYVDSYGLYHDDLSPELIDNLKTAEKK